MTRIRTLTAVALLAAAALFAPASAQAAPPSDGPSVSLQYHWQWGG